MPKGRRVPDPDEITKTTDLLYIQNNIDHLWRVATEGYQAHGRGAVLLDFRQSDKARDAAHFLTYAKEADWKKDEIAELVRIYNPADELVVLFGNTSPLTGEFSMRAYQWKHRGAASKNN